VSLARKKLEAALQSFYPGSITRIDRDPTTAAEPQRIPSNESNAGGGGGGPGRKKSEVESTSCSSSGSSGVNGRATTSIPSTVNPQKKLKLSQSQAQQRYERY